jgi:hypothetical protein
MSLVCRYYEYSRKVVIIACVSHFNSAFRLAKRQENCLLYCVSLGWKTQQSVQLKIREDYFIFIETIIRCIKKYFQHKLQFLTKHVANFSAPTFYEEHLLGRCIKSLHVSVPSRAIRADLVLTLSHITHVIINIIYIQNIK